jgi:hypothetical protein
MFKETKEGTTCAMHGHSNANESSFPTRAVSSNKALGLVFHALPSEIELSAHGAKEYRQCVWS